MITTLPQSRIHLAGLELSLFLGWPESERETPQTILLDVCIQFLEPPSACISDDLSDTFCYESLVNAIKATVQARPFRLLEHLGHTIYQTIKALLPHPHTLQICVKKQPNIPHLTGGVSFHYGDV
jgi:FolB domain-containing protein